MSRMNSSHLHSSRMNSSHLHSSRMNSSLSASSQLLSSCMDSSHPHSSLHTQEQQVEKTTYKIFISGYHVFTIPKASLSYFDECHGKHISNVISTLKSKSEEILEELKSKISPLEIPIQYEIEGRYETKWMTLEGKFLRYNPYRCLSKSYYVITKFIESIRNFRNGIISIEGYPIDDEEYYENSDCTTESEVTDCEESSMTEIIDYEDCDDEPYDDVEDCDHSQGYTTEDSYISDIEDSVG